MWRQSTSLLFYIKVDSHKLNFGRYRRSLNNENDYQTILEHTSALNFTISLLFYLSGNTSMIT